MNSHAALCNAMTTTVTAAHLFIRRYLYSSMQAAQKTTSKIRYVIPDKESSMSSLWLEKEFEQICSRYSDGKGSRS